MPPCDALAARHGFLSRADRFFPLDLRPHARRPHVFSLDPPLPSPPLPSPPLPIPSLSRTVVGLRCTDGVVLGVENPFISKMVEPGSASRTYAAARHAGLAVGGVDADGRAIAGRAQAEAVAYKK
jgi:hypothetical protein